MELKWNSRGGGGFKLKKTSVGGVWIISGATHCMCLPGYLFYCVLLIIGVHVSHNFPVKPH